jgi:hypothetical protein
MTYVHENRSKVHISYITFILHNSLLSDIHYPWIDISS